MPLIGKRHRAPRAVRGALALAVALVVAGCSEIGASGAIPEPTQSATPSAAPEPLISVVVVGDSLAAGDGHDSIPNDPGSWRMHLTGGMAVTGGWWRDGATTTTMANNLEPVEGDVLVVMGGTNDASKDVAVKTTLENMERIVSKVHADTVILCAIPPYSPDEEKAEQINEELESLALESGWFWLDPWELYRDGDAWAGDASPDGIHANAPVYRAAGEAIAGTIEGIVG